MEQRIEMGAVPVPPAVAMEASRAGVSVGNLGAGSGPRTTPGPTDSPSGGDVRIGEVLAGRYKVLRLLGSGGMGTVYLAEHAHLGRLTAVKVICPPLCEDDAEAEGRVRREALLAARLSHPNIAHVFDFERLADGRYLLALEYVEGETVAARLDRAGAFPVPEALRVLRGVASGLDHAHGLGVLHRDLKPENVMLGPAGRVTILDFGLALEAAAARTPEALAWGTPEYMSPEQLLGEPLAIASDVYSLGVVLYEMLTDRLPHAAKDLQALRARRVTERPMPVTEWRPDIPARLADAVARALDPDPPGRWPSVGDFARAAAEG